MRIKKIKNKNIRILTIAICGIIIIAAGYAGVAAYNNLWPFAAKENHTSDIDYDAPTEEQKTGGRDAIDRAKADQTQEEAAKPGADTQTGNDNKNIGVEITAMNQTDSQLQIRTMIHTVNSGTCTLTFTHLTHNEVTRTAESNPLAGMSSCKGFDIPINDLDSGDWNLTVEFRNDHGIGSTSKTVTIN